MRRVVTRLPYSLYLSKGVCTRSYHCLSRASGNGVCVAHAKCDNTIKRNVSYSEFNNDNLPDNERHYIVEVNSGNEKYQTGQLEEALEHYNRALKYRRNDPTALINRSAILQSMGKDDLAIKDLKTLVKQMEDIEVPDHFKRQTATAYLRLGEFMATSNNYKEAVKMIRRANELEPSTETEELLKETMAYSRPDKVEIHSLRLVVILTEDRFADDAKYFEQVTKGFDVEIKTSDVHGRGVFAKRDFEEGELVFISPSYATALVEDLRVKYKQPKVKKNEPPPPAPVNEGHCFHCLRPLPATVIHEWDSFTSNFENKRKYNLTNQKLDEIKTELHKFLGFKPGDFERVDEGEVHFCSNTCKDSAKSDYGTLLEQYEGFKLLLSVDKDSQDASILMGKVLAKLDKELPKGKPFALGNDLKRLANCPNPEIVPDLERPRFEALKALFPNREFFLQLRTLLNFNCFGVEADQSHFSFGVPESEVEEAKAKHVTTDPDSDHDEADSDTDLPLMSQHVNGTEGASLMLLGSFLNHSCDANVMMVDHLTHSREIPFVASAPIKKGQELFWCYAGKGMDGDTRRRILFLQYKFTCKCTRCKAEIGDKVTSLARGSIASS